MSEAFFGETVAVLGGGIGGLAAAYDLVRAGRKVTVFEAADFVGGLASGFKEPHWSWSVEKFYHHWFASDRHMLGLIDELGWSERVVFPRPYTVMYHQGKFYPFDSIPAAILFPGLGWGVNKARFGLVGLYLRLSKDWRTLENVTADAWMRKWAGNRVYELMWEPLLVGKFGEKYARQVNMAWLWARLRRAQPAWAPTEEASRLLPMILLPICGGWGWISAFLRPSSGLRFIRKAVCLCGLPLVRSVYNQTLVTTSPALLARLAPALPSGYLKGLLDLKSMGAVVMVLSLKQQLSERGYYWYNLPKSAGFPFLALVEHTNFLSPEYFGGDHIVYMGDYLEADHEYFQTGSRRAAEPLLAVSAQVQCKVLARLGKEGLAVPHQLCAAGPPGGSFPQYPCRPNPFAWLVLRQHEPGLSLGSGHKFRR